MNHKLTAPMVILIAFLLELGLRALQRRLTPWHGEGQ